MIACVIELVLCILNIQLPYVLAHTCTYVGNVTTPLSMRVIGAGLVKMSPYQWQHEPCLYGWKKKGKHQWYTGRKESTIWEFDKPKKNGDHPTMKPIPLLAYPIQNSSMANSVVLDPFGGSGSTLIACEQTDRICCTIELDEKFCDVIVRRYIEQVGTVEKVIVLRDGKEYKFSEVAPHDE